MTRYHMCDRKRFYELLGAWLGTKSKKESKINEAIIKFKAENNLGDGAEVDADTFASIRNVYLRRKRDESYGRLARGEQSDRVADLNLMLKRVVPIFSQDAPTPRGSYFGADTEAAILYLRRVFMMEGGGEADGALYERMRKELFAQKFFDE